MPPYLYILYYTIMGSPERRDTPNYFPPTNETNLSELLSAIAKRSIRRPDEVIGCSFKILGCGIKGAIVVLAGAGIIYLANDLKNNVGLFRENPETPTTTYATPERPDKLTQTPIKSRDPFDRVICPLIKLGESQAAEELGIDQDETVTRCIDEETIDCLGKGKVSEKCKPVLEMLNRNIRLPGEIIVDKGKGTFIITDFITYLEEEIRKQPSSIASRFPLEARIKILQAIIDAKEGNCSESMLNRQQAMAISPELFTNYASLGSFLEAILYECLGAKPETAQVIASPIPTPSETPKPTETPTPTKTERPTETSTPTPDAAEIKRRIEEQVRATLEAQRRAQEEYIKRLEEEAERRMTATQIAKEVEATLTQVAVETASAHQGGIVEEVKKAAATQTALYRELTETAQAARIPTSTPTPTPLSTPEEPSPTPKAKPVPTPETKITPYLPMIMRGIENPDNNNNKPESRRYERYNLIYSRGKIKPKAPVDNTRAILRTQEKAANLKFRIT